ncbi:hypothetical protein PDR5_08170 [Pseudomonas sp. DR 5-09]|nr:hypothetical protein PDR5_08170 [Pseudomonas sp. DR 5-09]
MKPKNQRLEENRIGLTDVGKKVLQAIPKKPASQEAGRFKPGRR